MLELRAQAVGWDNPIPDPQWDSQVIALPGASFFHSTAWAKVLNSTYGFAPLYCTDRSPEGLQGVLPMMEVDSWLTGRRGISLPFTDECAPICRETARFERLRTNLEERANNRKWKCWELRGGRSLFPDPPPPSSISFWGHTLTFEGNPAVLFSRLDGSTRRAVRKAEQSGLIVEFSVGLDAIRTFYCLLCLTRRRHGLPPQPLSFFENIHRHVLTHNHGIVVLAHLNQVPVAGAVFFHLGARAIYKFGASDDSFQNLRANNLVMWRAIEWYSKKGYVDFDFGRTSRRNEGLRRFKRAWGTNERVIHYIRHDLKESRFVTSRDDSQGWHNRLFRHIPPTLSRVIGALVYKHIA